MKVAEYVRRYKEASEILNDTYDALGPLLFSDAWWCTFPDDFGEEEPMILAFSTEQDARSWASLEAFGMDDTPRPMTPASYSCCEQRLEDGVICSYHDNRFLLCESRFVPCLAPPSLRRMNPNESEGDYLTWLVGQVGYNRATQIAGHASVEAFREKHEALRHLEMLKAQNGNTLHLALTVPDLVEKTERSLAVMGLRIDVNRALGTSDPFMIPMLCRRREERSFEEISNVEPAL